MSLTCPQHVFMAAVAICISALQHRKEAEQSISWHLLTTSGELCPVLGPPAQEIHTHAGACHKDDWDLEHRLVHFQKAKVKGDSVAAYNFLRG